MGSDEPKEVSFQANDRSIGRAAESRGAFGHDVHHRLEVGRRARDDPQDLGGGRLLFERLFRLVEQSDILDGDHGLVGEGPQQGDLLSEKGPASSRATVIAPMVVPSRSIGTDRTLLVPATLAQSWLRYSGSLWTSGM